MLCFTWMQYLTYTLLFWWNLSSTSIDRVIFNFLPRNSLLNMFADLMYLFLSSSFLTWMKACVIGFAGIQSTHFQSSSLLLLSILSGVVWPPVQMFHCGILKSLPYFDSGLHVLPWVRHLCFRFPSMSRIFLSIFVILSLNCLYLSSSSFIFTMGEFIPWSCAQTESVIFCRNFYIFSSFFHLIFWVRRLFLFLKKRVFTWSRQFAFTRFIQLPFSLSIFFWFKCVHQARSFPFLPAVSGTFQS